MRTRRWRGPRISELPSSFPTSPATSATITRPAAAISRPTGSTNTASIAASRCGRIGDPAWSRSAAASPISPALRGVGPCGRRKAAVPRALGGPGRGPRLRRHRPPGRDARRLGLGNPGDGTAPQKLAFLLPSLVEAVSARRELMAHFAFIGPPLRGHYKPLSHLAAELIARGHRGDLHPSPGCAAPGRGGRRATSRRNRHAARRRFRAGPRRWPGSGA